jgi:hypothetical protein
MMPKRSAADAGCEANRTVGIVLPMRAENPFAWLVFPKRNRHLQGEMDNDCHILVEENILAAISRRFSCKC